MVQPRKMDSDVLGGSPPRSDAGSSAPAKRAGARDAGAASSQRVAAYDLGSNSFRLLVAEPDGQGGLVELARGHDEVCLGEHALRDGVIPFPTFQRGLDGLIGLRRIADGFAPEHTIAVATSAIREARNGPDFVHAVAREVGLAVEVLDPVKEATLIYWGARRSLEAGRRFALFDVGGGSIKAVVGDSLQCRFATSLPMGFWRLRDQCAHDQLNHHPALLTAETRVRAVVQPAVRQMLKLGFDFVTFTSSLALALAQLAQGDGERMADPRGRSGEGMGRHLLLSLARLRALEARLSTTPPGTRPTSLGDMIRTDTILPGTLLLRTLLELTGQDSALVCESALSEGLVVDYFVRHEAGKSGNKTGKTGLTGKTGKTGLTG